MGTFCRSPWATLTVSAVEVSTISQIIPFANTASAANAAKGRLDGPARTNSIRFSTHSVLSTDASSLASAATQPSYTFSLMNGDHLIAELTAPDADTYSEWLDGLNLLRPDGYISTKETANLVHTLTQIGTQVKLLDLSGERVEIPRSVALADITAHADVSSQ